MIEELELKELDKGKPEFSDYKEFPIVYKRENGALSSYDGLHGANCGSNCSNCCGGCECSCKQGGLKIFDSKKYN